MSEKWQDDVTEFHRAFCPEQVAAMPTLPNMSIRDLRIRLIDEELSELEQALDSADLNDVADAIVDLLYVTIGTAVACGLDIAPIWGAVHAANMRKIPTRREDGKVIKNPDFVPPDIASILATQKPLGEHA